MAQAIMEAIQSLDEKTVEGTTIEAILKTLQDKFPAARGPSPTHDGGRGQTSAASASAASAASPSAQSSAISAAPSSKPSRGDIDVASVGVKSLSEYPLYKPADDFGVWLSGFAAKASALPHLSDEAKLDLLTMRLTQLGASILRMIRPRPFDEAILSLSTRMSAKTTIAIADGLDLSLIHQEEAETGFLFYQRLASAVGQSQPNMPEAEFTAMLSSKLTLALKEQVQAFKPSSLDALLHVLKVYDNTVGAKVVVNAVGTRCFKCNKSGHRATDCYSSPDYAPAASRGRSRGRGRFRGRGRGQFRGRGRGRGQPNRHYEAPPTDEHEGRRRGNRGGRKKQRKMVNAIESIDAASRAITGAPSPSGSAPSATPGPPT